MFFEGIILVVTLVIVRIIVDNYFPRKRFPPGPFRLPVLGNALTFLKGRNKPPFVLFRELNRKYGPVAYFRMGSKPTIVIDDFNISKKLLNSETWIDRPYNDLILERSFGKPLGIIFVAGDGWREMRRFSMRTLRDFGYGKVTDMQVVIDDEVALLMEKVEKVASKPDPILDVKHLFTMPVLNILWSMVSAVRAPNDEERLHELAMLVDTLARATPIGGTILDLFPWLRHVAPGLTGATFVRGCEEKLQNYFQEVLDDRRKEGGYKQEGRDFIDKFINEIDKHRELRSVPNHYTDEQFITTATDLFEAGSETSSNTLEFAIYYATMTPRVQQKVQQEIDRVVGQSRLPSMSDRALMPYTEATLMEVQRMANVLPMTVRSPTEDCFVDGYFVEKDTIGIINIYAIHMDLEFWGDPYVFRPERFLDANNAIIPHMAARVIPFGAGKRVCLGEQMARTTLFAYFTTLLQAYRLSMVEKEVQSDNNQNWNSLADMSDPDEYLFKKLVNVGFTLSPNPYQVKLAKRH